MSVIGSFLLKAAQWLGKGLKNLLGIGDSGSSGGLLSNVGQTLSNVAQMKIASQIRQKENEHLSGKETEQNMFNAKEAALQRDFSHQERLEAQEFNAAQAQKQMDFQEYMSNTQYQRQVADMQAAGVNPAMAMGGITGASASGAMATSSPASGAAASGSAQLQGLSDLLEFAQLKSEIEKTQAETENIKEDTRGSKIGNDIQDEFGRDIASAQLSEMYERIHNLAAQTDSEEFRQALMAAETALRELEADPGSFINFEKTWRSAYIREYGATPETGLLKQLVQSTLKGMRDFWSAVFHWQNPLKDSPDSLPFDFPKN